jgi:hypothetical protein
MLTTTNMVAWRKFEVMADKVNVQGMCALITCFFNISIGYCYINHAKVVGSGVQIEIHKSNLVLQFML